MLDNTSNFFTKIKETLDKITVVEDKGHLDHPEDLVILDDIPGAERAVQSIIDTAQDPKAITIKWDGYPALIFGRGVDGKFSIMDKHMFNKKDGTGRQIFSPEQFAEYDQARGVNRAELNVIITNIWESLQKASQDTQGYYWGDFLFSKPLKEQNGLYKFKANPNGITYTVDSNSEIGRLLKGKIAGIAVHQYIRPDATTTDQAESLNGTIGLLKNNTNVAIVPSAMPTVPKIVLDNKLLNYARTVISKNAKVVDELMNNSPQARNSFNQLFTTFINKQIVSGDVTHLSNKFMDYFESRPMSDSMKKKLEDHINANRSGIVGLFTIWAAIYNLKMNLVNQLAKAAAESSVKGYLDSGQQSQEGFVSKGLKFVDRLGFSRQNLGSDRRSNVRPGKVDRRGDTRV